MGLVAKAFQDIITFSRATQTGTYVNSNGYITNSSVLNYLTYSNQPENAAWTKSNSFVQQNLLTYSQEFDNAAWVKSAATLTANATIAPDGTLTADTLIDDGTSARHSLNQNPTVVASAPYTLSLYVKAGTGRYVTLSVSRVAVGSTYYAARYDLQTSTVTATAASGSTTHVASSIINVGSGWYRCDLTGILSTFTDAVVMVSGAINPTGFGDRGAEVYVGSGFTWLLWGAQLVQGSVPGDYRATTSAALPCLYADYNGALRARKFCEDATASTTHRILPNTALTIDAAGTYAYSWYVKAGELTEARLTDNNVLGATFNLTTGASSSVSSGYTASSVSLGNGWWRLIISGAAATVSGRILIYLSKAGSTTYTGDGSSGIYIADAQLNDGSSALSYYDTTASAYNAPRFDYDPVTLAAKGLLVEESRANLLLQSNDWSATWINSNITRTASAALGPDGQMSMTKLEAATSTNTTCRQSLVATSTAHTFSVYVKQGSGATQANLFAVYNNTTATDIAVLNFNYSTGVVTQTTGTGATATNVGNGIWRIIIPVTSGITVGNTITVYPLFSGAVETTGEFAYVYGAQVEAGAFATSYIPTVASQVTRAADVASVNTLSPWFNSVAGTLYAEFLIRGLNPAASNAAVSLSDGTTSNFIVNRINTTPQGNFTVRVATVDQATISDGTASLNTTMKIAGVYATNDFAASVNGAAAITDTSGTVPTVNQLVLGVTGTTGTNPLNGWLRRITYYPRRMTNAELQTLTTL